MNKSSGWLKFWKTWIARNPTDPGQIYENHCIWLVGWAWVLIIHVYCDPNNFNSFLTILSRDFIETYSLLQFPSRLSTYLKLHCLFKVLENSVNRSISTQPHVVPHSQICLPPRSVLFPKYTLFKQNSSPSPHHLKTHSQTHMVSSPSPSSGGD